MFRDSTGLTTLVPKSTSAIVIYNDDDEVTQSVPHRSPISYETGQTDRWPKSLLEKTDYAEGAMDIAIASWLKIKMMQAWISKGLKANLQLGTHAYSEIHSAHETILWYLANCCNATFRRI